MRVALAHSWRERGGGGGGEGEREKEREFAFVYICMCTLSSVRTCVWCRSMRVKVFIKLLLVLTYLFYM